METIYNGIDTINGKSYELRRYNAKALSALLKDNYKSLGKDYSIYDTISTENGEYLKEIYEYQNFSLFELSDGKVILLDGFRRLLCYDTPDIDITVRVYKHDDFTRSELLLLLVNYNQFKLVGNSGGKYFERGFYFLIDVLFNLKLKDFTEAMTGYLEKEIGDDSYYFPKGGRDGNKLINVPQRIINEDFLNDMFFINDIDVPFKNTQFFGGLVFELRKKGFNGQYNVQVISDLINENEGVKKQKKIIDAYGLSEYRGQKAFGEIGLVYKSIFNELIGIKREITYAEKVSICDLAIAELKADKNYFKISGKKNYYEISAFVKNIGLDKISFRGVVYPCPDTKFRTYGVVNDLFGVFEVHKSFAGSYPMLEIYLKDKGKEIKAKNSGYSTWSRNYSKKWTEISLYDSEDGSITLGRNFTSRIDVYMFVEGMSKRDIEKALKK